MVFSSFQLMSLNNVVKHMIVNTYICCGDSLCKPVLMLISLIKLVVINTMLRLSLFIKTSSSQKRVKNVGSVGSVGKSEKSPQKI